MARAACKAAIDGAYLVTTGNLANRSKEIQSVFESRGGSKIVWEISDLCHQLMGMIDAALQPSERPRE